jgi:hypothetical protein
MSQQEGMGTGVPPQQPRRAAAARSDLRRSGGRSELDAPRTRGDAPASDNVSQTRDSEKGGASHPPCDPRHAHMCPGMRPQPLRGSDPALAASAGPAHLSPAPSRASSRASPSRQLPGGYRAWRSEIAASRTWPIRWLQSAAASPPMATWRMARGSAVGRGGTAPLQGLGASNYDCSNGLRARRRLSAGLEPRVVCTGGQVGPARGKFAPQRCDRPALRRPASQRP